MGLAGMAIPEMRDGKLTKEEYKEIEDQVRTQATALLKSLREQAPEVKGRIESEARKYLAILTSYADKYLQEALDGMQDLQPAFEMYMSKVEKYFEKPDKIAKENQMIQPQFSNRSVT